MNQSAPPQNEIDQASGDDRSAEISRLQKEISDIDTRIERQEKRVAKLSIDFGPYELRDQAKALLAEMTIGRALLISALEEETGDTRSGHHG